MCDHITEHALVEGIVRTAGQWKKQQRRLWLKQRLPARSQGASPLLTSNSTRSVAVVSTSPQVQWLQVSTSWSIQKEFEFGNNL